MAYIIQLTLKMASAELRYIKLFELHFGDCQNRYQSERSYHRHVYHNFFEDANGLLLNSLITMFFLLLSQLDTTYLLTILTVFRFFIYKYPDAISYLARLRPVYLISIGLSPFHFLSINAYSQVHQPALLYL
ncbi:hypothetical protein ACTXT7_007136 [Hymenolepis weldensis]